MRKTIVAFGETLWDLLPSGPVLGGAPCNFAYRVNSLGSRGVIVTRLGRDDLGRKAFERLVSLGMETDHVQWDDLSPTGTVPVRVGPDGTPDFLEYTTGRNGRAIAFREDMDFTDDSIDLPRADLVIFITRREDIVPAAARLTPEQAAAMFMLGESIETEAGDPARAGQPVHSVGTNPFIIGPEGEEGNIFRRFMAANPDVQCFLLNTGSIGLRDEERRIRTDAEGKPMGVKIKIKDSTELIKQMARGGIRWEVDPDWGYEVPVEVEGIPDYAERLDPRRYYTPEAYAEITRRIKEDRRAWLAQFTELDPAIPASLKL